MEALLPVFDFDGIDFTDLLDFLPDDMLKLDIFAMWLKQALGVTFFGGLMKRRPTIF